MSTVATELLPADLVARLERLELVSRKVFRGRMKGERRSRRKGQSVEFADFRNYVAGDDLRQIDWNLYARLDQLFLKMFLEEEDLHFYALIDASESMNFGDPTKLHVAKQLAACLGYIGLCRADRVKVTALGKRGTQAPVMRGKSNLWRMLQYLQSVQPGENVSLYEGVKDFALRNSGSGIAVLITDLLDKQGYEQALRMLLGRRMDVYVIHLLAPEELEPPLQGDLKLVDSEDGDLAEVTINRHLLDRYRETVEAFVDTARGFCSRRSITYMLARTDMPVDEMVTRYLRERGVVR
ncbi:DUF58 domain-containing protein [Roseimaritima multifibrata]|nr:DUF58 domain-containing protein [Roseimaritima multifibrata]